MIEMTLAMAERAVRAGIIVVAAAGNQGKTAEGKSVFGAVTSPGNSPYALTVGAEIAIYVIFAVSLHFLMSVGGLASFGHAAYFGLGAYGVAFFAKAAGLPMVACLLLGPLLGLLGAAVFGFFAVQLSGVYFAMLTLAFAQIVWSVALAEVPLFVTELAPRV